jgi:hypothetical protein
LRENEKLFFSRRTFCGRTKNYFSVAGRFAGDQRIIFQSPDILRATKELLFSCRMFCGRPKNYFSVAGGWRESRPRIFHPLFYIEKINK